MKTLEHENRKGFTSIELLISIGVLSLLVALSLASFINLRTNASLNGTAQEILSNLKLAQARTVASDGQKSYGVRFSAASYIVFPTPFDGANPLNQTFTLPSSLQIVDAGLAGWPDVIFDRITGRTANYGSLQVEKISGTETRVIKIDNSGNAYVSTTSYGTGIIIADFRHIHFDYGLNIDTATENITLTFYNSPNPNTVQVIPIIGNLDSDNHFNWSGAVNVNGSNQVLTIHTHRLNSSGTQFSILRDQANNKAFDMQITGCAPFTLVVYDTIVNASQGSCISVSAPQKP